MITKMLSKGLPKCTNCMFYIPYGVSKSYDLAKCSRFVDKKNQPIYAEMARMDDFKCSIYGYQYRSLITLPPSTLAPPPTIYFQGV